MVKKTKSLKITTGFWKGLIVGIVLTAIGTIIYFKFVTPAKYPPTNLYGGPTPCELKCPSNYTCYTNCKECEKSCSDQEAPCTSKCTEYPVTDPRYNECIYSCYDATRKCIDACH